MAVTTALMIGATAVGALSSIATGIQENKQAEINSKIYNAQAQNIATQKDILSGQYMTKQRELEGSAVTNAARGGLKISGSTAKSISNSIMALQMDRSYQVYNLEVQRQQALDNARFQREKGKQALMSGFLKAGTSALSAGAGYFGGQWGNFTGFNGFGGTKLSGGTSFTNQSLISGNTTIV